MKRRNKLIGGAVIIIFALYVVATFAANLTPYMEVSAVVAKGEATNVQVNGTIVNGSTTFDGTTNTLTFQITDGKQVITVVHSGRINNYQEGNPVVVKGDYKDGIFYAEEVLVKCPSKYVEVKEE